MTDRDERITALYRHSSREEPPAALDHAVLRQARKAVKPRRAAAPFGNAWMAAGTLVSVCLVGVLLVLVLPDRAIVDVVPYLSEGTGVERSASEGEWRRESVPDRQLLLEKDSPGLRDEVRQRAPATGSAVSGQPGEDAAQNRAPAFDSAIVPPVAPVPQRLESLKKSVESKSATAEIYYLQTGLFRDSASVPALRARLEAVGLNVIVDEITLDATQWHRVRVGPLRTRAALAQARHQLNDLGIVFKPESRGQ